MLDPHTLTCLDSRISCFSVNHQSTFIIWLIQQFDVSHHCHTKGGEGERKLWKVGEGGTKASSPCPPSSTATDLSDKSIMLTILPWCEDGRKRYQPSQLQWVSRLLLTAKWWWQIWNQKKVEHKSLDHCNNLHTDTCARGEFIVANQIFIATSSIQCYIQEVNARYST